MIARRQLLAGAAGLATTPLSALAAARASPGGMAGDRAGAARTFSGIRFRWAPQGGFLMGSPATEPGRKPDEDQVRVSFSSGFWMGQYELTQAQWKRTMGALPGSSLLAGAGDDYPVYWVSFLAAQDYCRKITTAARATGELPMDWRFDIPTEAQWEYACRAGTTTAFAFGDRLTSTQAAIGRPWRGLADGTPGQIEDPVGRFPANAWGIHDMHGNAFEWTRDWYHATLPGGLDPLMETPGVRNGDGTYSRTRRGGAWMDPPEGCRSASRWRYEPERNADHIGLRIAVATGR